MSFILGDLTNGMLARVPHLCAPFAQRWDSTLFRPRTLRVVLSHSAGLPSLHMVLDLSRCVLRLPVVGSGANQMYNNP